MSNLTFIMPCKNRLEHLKITLPIAAAQDAHVIVVDYSCTQHSGDWAKSLEKDNIRVVYKEHEYYYNHSKARNIGASHASTEYIMFLDSDILLVPDFIARIKNLILDKTSYYCSIQTNVLTSQLIITKENFLRAEGFDEDARGYGYEDTQFMSKLHVLGIPRVHLPDNLMRHLDHDDKLRDACYEKKMSESYEYNLGKLNANLSKFAEKHRSKK